MTSSRRLLTRLQAWTRSSLGKLVNTSLMDLMRESLVLWGDLLVSLSATPHTKKSKGLRSGLLGGHTSFSQKWGKLALHQSCVILSYCRVCSSCSAGPPSQWSSPASQSSLPPLPLPSWTPHGRHPPCLGRAQPCCPSGCHCGACGPSFRCQSPHPSLHWPESHCTALRSS